MRFSIDVGGELELKLHQAILLYRNEQVNRHMATVHGIPQTATDGAPILGAGRLLTTAVLRELARTLGTACPAEFVGTGTPSTINIATERGVNNARDFNKPTPAERRCGWPWSIRGIF